MIGAKLIALVLLGQAPDLSPDADALVKKLGSASYAEREDTRSLEILGNKALPALRSALRSRDPEVRVRARALIKKIEGNLLGQESLVRLDFKNATIDEIVKSLSKQAGIEVGIGQAWPDPGARRITLSEPQAVPFWKAVDQLCDQAHFICQYNFTSLNAHGATQPSLLLLYDQGRVAQPTYNHGAFHFNVVSVSYQSDIYFQSFGPTFARPVPPARGVAGIANKKTARPLVEPLSIGAQRRHEALNASNAPLRIVQFRVQLWFVSEPRITLDEPGKLELLEAVDDLGQSLMAGSSEGDRPPEPTILMGVGMAGPLASLTILLSRPEAPGKFIKTLRGTVEVSVSAARANPIVIPLEGAVGKTFKNGDRQVVVNSVDTDRAQRQSVIELTVENLDELFPAEPIDGPRAGAPAGRMGIGFGRPIGGDPSRWPIQIITSSNQQILYNTSIDWDLGRVSLRFLRMGQMGEPREIRIANIVRAKTKVPFEFHDLPMP